MELLTNFINSSNSLKFLYIAYFLSIFMNIASAVIMGAVVIPLQYKEAGVQNGLHKLRRWMLIMGFTMFVVLVASILALSGRFIFGVGDDARYVVSTMIIIHSIGFLVIALIHRGIYKGMFTPRQKKLHRQVAKMEKSESKKTNKKLLNANK